MGSKSSRQRRRKKRKKGAAGSGGLSLDVHAETVMSGLGDLVELAMELATQPDPVAAATARIDEIIETLRINLAPIEPLSALEVIRLVCLPFSADSEMPPAGAQDGLAVAEVLAIASATATAGTEMASLSPAGPDTGGLLSEKLAPLVRQLLDLASVKDLLAAERMDAMDAVAASIRASGRWIRATSYPGMQEGTLVGLFGDTQGMDDLLRREVGFTVGQAISVLNACHQLQMEMLNRRGQGLADAFNSVDRTPGRTPTEEERARVLAALQAVFAPAADQSAVSIDRLAAVSRTDISLTWKVVEFFALQGLELTTHEAVSRFLDGDSPLAKAPLVWRGGDHVALVHHALIPPAIKDGLEAALMSTPGWETYQAHRAKYLERRIEDLVGRVLPGSIELHDLEYFVPKDDTEAGDPSKFTKLVEGDHLFVLDDVAVIVEDKAIPLSARSRTGELNPLRRNLGAAIAKGAEQAARLRARIEADRGVRLRNGDWVDLSAVRETHSIVTSLDDLSGVSTATDRLMQAGLLSSGDIPWTVSLHDLDLITQLVERPAEFLLYLRRRRHSEATAMYIAPDELDLFLHFFHTGLYVQPDPDVVSADLQWAGAPTTSDRRRRAEQAPTLITSQTDELDAWYYSLHPPEGTERSQVSAKPRMTPSPLDPVIAALTDRGVFAAASIGATLLEGSSEAQRQIASIPGNMLDNPDPNGRERSVAVPWGTSRASGWLLVWMSRPPSLDGEAVARKAQTYLRLKKHQLGLPRGVAFVYDEPTRVLYATIYDADALVLDEEHEASAMGMLRPLGDMQPWAQVSRMRGTKRRRRR